MFRKVSSLALAICALGGGMILAEPAIADGWWGRGSIKDRVPVPAPVPIPDHAARWYLRADLGLGFASADPSESGIIYGQDWWTPEISGTSTFWTEDDIEATFTYGAGFGYYWSPNFRTDVTLEGRSERSLKIRGTHHYIVDPPDGLEVLAETADTGKIGSGIFLFNAYFDFLRTGPLTPYIGAGVGFSMNKLKRDFTITGECSGCTGSVTLRASDSTYDVAFAGALMAGLTYSISPVTMLDLNYRYLYIGSSDIDLKFGNLRSHFSTGDTHEHQIRVGLRWNIQ